MEDEVLNIQDGGKGAIKGVVCQGNTYEARSLILATGAVHRKLGVPGEEEAGRSRSVLLCHLRRGIFPQ